MKFPIYNGRVAVNFGTPIDSDKYRNGLRLECDLSSLYVTSSHTGGVASDGFWLAEDGSLVVVECQGALPDGYNFSNGLPVDKDGAVCVSSTDPVHNWENGVPFTAYGAVAVGPDDDPVPSPDPNDEVFEILAKYGKDAHMWMPGERVVDGINVKNWLNIAGTVEAQEAQPVARMDDIGGGDIYLVQNVESRQAILNMSQDGHYYWAFDDATSTFYDMSAIPFQMSDDAIVIAGVAAANRSTSDSAVIYAGADQSNHRLPMFCFTNGGKLSIYAMGSNMNITNADGGPDNRGQGPLVATFVKTGMNAKVRRNGVQIIDTEFHGSYPEATRSAIGIMRGGSLIGSSRGSMYPLIIIKAKLPEREILILEQFVSRMSGVA